jgi:hypothetical protein
MLSKTAKKLTTSAMRPVRRRTLRGLSTKVARLQSRVDDIEDLSDLNEAISRNEGKPGIPWDRAKSELGL